MLRAMACVSSRTNDLALVEIDFSAEDQGPLTLVDVLYGGRPPTWQLPNVGAHRQKIGRAQWQQRRQGVRINVTELSASRHAL